MVVKIKQDDRDRLRLVIFEDGLVKACGGMLIFILSLEVLLIVLLIVNWKVIEPIYDQTPFGIFIPMLGVIFACLYLPLVRAVKYITIDKRRVTISIFNLLWPVTIPIADVDHVEVGRKGGFSLAWLVTKDGVKKQLYRQLDATTTVMNPRISRYTFKQQPDTLASKPGAVNAVFVIEKILCLALSKAGKTLEPCNFPSVKDYVDWRGKGLDLIETGDVDGAVLSFRLAVEQDPSDAFSWRDLAVLLEQQGDSHGASDAFSKVIEYLPRDKEAIQHLKALSGTEHPAFAIVKSNSFLVKNWGWIGFTIAATATITSIIAAFLVMGALLAPELLVAGSDWPVPDIAGRIRYGAIAGTVLFIANTAAFLVWKGSASMPNKDVEEFVAINFFCQFIMFGLILMMYTGFFLGNGVVDSIASIRQMNADVPRLSLFSIAETLMVLYMTALALPSFLDFSSNKKDARNKRWPAASRTSKDDMKMRFPYNPKVLLMIATRLLANVLTITFLNWITFHLRIMPAMVPVYIACLPHAFYPFIDPARRIVWRALPGLVIEATFVAVVALDWLWPVHVGVACVSLLAMFWAIKKQQKRMVLQ